jgi:hypothetical protein
MEGYGIQDRVKNGPALAGRGAEAVKNAVIDAVAFLPEKPDFYQLVRTFGLDDQCERLA